MILVFASQIVRLNNPPTVAQFIRKNLFFEDGTEYRPGMVIHMKYFKNQSLCIKDELRQQLFPANVGTCLDQIPKDIRDLFGSFSFEAKIKEYTDNKCPHGATVKASDCDGCIRHNSLINTVVKKTISYRSSYHLTTLATMANRLVDKHFSSLDDVTAELAGTLVDFNQFIENMDTFQS